MSNIRTRVGLKIKQLREKKGWSQEQLGFEADLHRAYIGHVERGEKNLGIVNLEKICNALGIDMAEIFRK